MAVVIPQSPDCVRMYPSGGWEVSDIIDGYLRTRRYFGYTKREAVRDFIEHETRAAMALAKKGGE